MSKIGKLELFSHENMDEDQLKQLIIEKARSNKKGMTAAGKAVCDELAREIKKRDAKFDKEGCGSRDTAILRHLEIRLRILRGLVAGFERERESDLSADGGSANRKSFSVKPKRAAVGKSANPREIFDEVTESIHDDVELFSALSDPPREIIGHAGTPADWHRIISSRGCEEITEFAQLIANSEGLSELFY